MIVKELRNGTFLRCYNNDTISIGMRVKFPTNGIVEPYIEISMVNGLNLPINRLNENYNIIKSRLSESLTNRENPIKIAIDYVCLIDDVNIHIIQDITDKITIGNNKISLLDCYTESGVTLRSMIGEKSYEINTSFKLSGHIKKLPQIQLPYLDLVFNKNPFFSNISVMSEN